MLYLFISFIEWHISEDLKLWPVFENKLEMKISVAAELRMKNWTAISFWFGRIEKKNLLDYRNVLLKCTENAMCSINPEIPHPFPPLFWTYTWFGLCNDKNYTYLFEPIFTSLRFIFLRTFFQQSVWIILC